MRRVETDPGSGFCKGVIRAISTAEAHLRTEGHMYSLGAIVHNEAELSRLEGMGLETIVRDDISSRKPGTLLIRAHGEPPSVYDLLTTSGYTIIDCTCPVVLKLQQDIRQAYTRVKALASPGQVLIFGKIGHPEVLGLLGQVDNDALVVENMDQLEDILLQGLLKTDSEIELFSQTTKSPAGYLAIQERLRPIFGDRMNVHDTICRQVSKRHSQLKDFASKHDVIVFVSGRQSSNGQVLCRLCASVNPRTFHISSVSEIDPSWFGEKDSVGICGATSTPGWLLDKVAETIENLQ